MIEFNEKNVSHKIKHVDMEMLLEGEICCEDKQLYLLTEHIGYDIRVISFLETNDCMDAVAREMERNVHKISKLIWARNNAPGLGGVGYVTPNL